MHITEYHKVSWSHTGYLSQENFPSIWYIYNILCDLFATEHTIPSLPPHGRTYTIEAHFIYLTTMQPIVLNYTFSLILFLKKIDEY